MEINLQQSVKKKRAMKLYLPVEKWRMLRADANSVGTMQRSYWLFWSLMLLSLISQHYRWERISLFELVVNEPFKTEGIVQFRKCFFWGSQTSTWRSHFSTKVTSNKELVGETIPCWVLQQQWELSLYHGRGCRSDVYTQDNRWRLVPVKIEKRHRKDLLDSCDQTKPDHMTIFAFLTPCFHLHRPL